MKLTITRAEALNAIAQYMRKEYLNGSRETPNAVVRFMHTETDGGACDVEGALNIDFVEVEFNNPTP